jgi:hypothetical protein
MSPIDNLADRLARVQSAFDAAPVGFDNQPPDGDYQTLVHDFDFFQGGTPRRAYMKMRLQVQHHPEEAGRFAEKVYSIEEEDGIGYLKADLHRLGVNVQGMNIGQAITSGALAEELYDVPVLVRVKRPAGKTNKRGEQVVNVYIQRRLGDPDRSARRDLERNGASDVPEPAAGEFVHPEQASLDDVPFTGEEPAPEGQRNQEAHLRRLGCVCDDPVKVELKQSVGDIDCSLPGHAPF